MIYFNFRDELFNLREWLIYIASEYQEFIPEGIEVRINWDPYDNSLNYLHGDPQYDQSHLGCWGYGCICDDDPDYLDDLAQSMLSELCDEIEYKYSENLDLILW